MANQKQSGRNVSQPDENRPSWGPQDQNARPRGERDEDRDEDRRVMEQPGHGQSRWDPHTSKSRLGGYWADQRDESQRSTERYGQGQSGYGAGRGTDRAMIEQQAPNQSYGGPPDRDRMGTDDRFTGRGGSSYWMDRGERGERSYRGGLGESREPTGYGRSHDTGYSRTREPFDTLERNQSSNPYGDGRGHRGKGPRGYKRSDERIREHVCEALSDDDRIDASGIEILVKDGEVIICGTVDDRRTKRMAEDVVERIPGVTDVQNQLRIRRENEPDRGNPRGRQAVGTSEAEASTDKKHRA